jgi:2-polyprenyl-3-methyl-5-hydroxy-6-metoxy-1,4-benzoquinol methylase
MMPASANSVLDAGAGPGVMMNYFLLNNNYSNVVAIDQTADNDLVELSPHQNFKIMDICKLDFETNAFELVICTQVLEHLLDEEQINQALRELRRVSSKTLIISVPFEEPEPLNTGHYHAFDLTKIKKLFPSGTYTIIDHGNFNAKFKHIFIVEVKE